MPTRRIFISYEGSDRKKAKGFRLLRWNKNVDVEFQDRHLLDPVDSKDPSYIKRCIGEQIKGTSVTVVLVGEDTAESDWVEWEIKKSLENGNGLLAIKIDDSIPDENIPDAVVENGGEVIDWNPEEFDEAIERAAQQKDKVGKTTVKAKPGRGCGRV